MAGAVAASAEAGIKISCVFFCQYAGIKLGLIAFPLSQPRAVGIVNVSEKFIVPGGFIAYRDRDNAHLIENIIQVVSSVRPDRDVRGIQAHMPILVERVGPLRVDNAFIPPGGGLADRRGPAHIVPHAEGFAVIQVMGAVDIDSVPEYIGFPVGNIFPGGKIGIEGLPFPESRYLLPLRRSGGSKYHLRPVFIAVGIPFRQLFAVPAFSVRIPVFDEVREIVAHLPGKVKMASPERPPAFPEGFEEKPEVAGMKASRPVPSGDIGIKEVIIHLCGIRISGLRVQKSGFYRFFDRIDSPGAEFVPGIAGEDRDRSAFTFNEPFQRVVFVHLPVGKGEHPRMFLRIFRVSVPDEESVKLPGFFETFHAQEFKKGFPLLFRLLKTDRAEDIIVFIKIPDDAAEDGGAGDIFEILFACHLVQNAAPARGLAGDGDSGRIAAEGSDVSPDPFQSGLLVQQTEIPGSVRGFIRDLGMREKTEGAQSVGGADHDDSPAGKALPVKFHLSRIAPLEPASEIPDKDGQFLAGSFRRGPHIQVKAVFTDGYLRIHMPFPVIEPVPGAGRILHGDRPEFKRIPDAFPVRAGLRRSPAVFIDRRSRKRHPFKGRDPRVGAREAAQHSVFHFCCPKHCIPSLHFLSFETVQHPAAGKEDCEAA